MFREYLESFVCVCVCPQKKPPHIKIDTFGSKYVIFFPMAESV